jgi:hypothetical protein
MGKCLFMTFSVTRHPHVGVIEEDVYGLPKGERRFLVALCKSIGSGHGERLRQLPPLILEDPSADTAAGRVKSAEVARSERGLHQDADPLSFATSLCWCRGIDVILLIPESDHKLAMSLLNLHCQPPIVDHTARCRVYKENRPQQPQSVESGRSHGL